jgi:hypothetical protein
MLRESGCFEDDGAAWLAKLKGRNLKRLAEAVDAVPDVEAEPEAEEDEAGELADQVLAALPAEVRAALATKLKQEE